MNRITPFLVCFLLSLLACHVDSNDITFYYDRNIEGLSPSFVIIKNKKNGDQAFIEQEESEPVPMTIIDTGESIVYRGLHLPLEVNHFMEFPRLGGIFNVHSKSLILDTTINGIMHERCFEYILSPGDSAVDLSRERILFNHNLEVIVKHETIDSDDKTMEVVSELIRIAGI